MKGFDLKAELPEGWEVRRLKTVTQLKTSNVDKNRNEDEKPVRLCNYTDVYYSSEIVDASTFMEATATPEEIRRFRLRRGDVLVTKDSETADDIAVPAYVARDFDDVLCGYHLAIYRPNREIDGKYLYYALLTDRVGDQFALGANGITRFGLSQDVLKDAVVPIPDMETQRAVASFLDRETGKIDTLIEKKQRLLDLLEEKRTALITRAVTKGLDPDVPMKDSGVEWIGEIPEHWEVVRIRRAVGEIEQGWSPQCHSHPADSDRWGILKSGCVNKGVFSESQNKALPESIDPRPALQVRPGDLLMSRASGSTDLIGSAAFVERCRDRLMLSDKVFRLHTRDALVKGRYLALALTSNPARAQIRLAISGAGGLANNISQQSVMDLVVALPPKNEQGALAEYVADEESQICRVQDKASSAISLLQEYRTALISAAITGGVDVEG